MILTATALAVLTRAPAADAARYTPERWRTIVETHADSNFVGQRKHVGWNRDRDSNFVDDEIESRFRRGDSVNVVVELNRCALPQDVDGLLSAFGRVTYVGRLISCAYMKGVAFEDLPRLAALPQVAMVEWQTPLRAATGVTTRAVQALESDTYGTGNAARTSTDKSADGSGVVIAIFDCGVSNDHDAVPHSGSADAESFAGGFDATIFEDSVKRNGVDDSYEDASTCAGACLNEPGDGSTDPVPPAVDGEHGTEVAFIALGRSSAGSDCRKGSDETTDPDCEGVAPAARLLDVKVCVDKKDCDFEKTADGDVMQGIDWLARYHETVPVGVANFSIYDASECDGTCALCEAVNYLAFLGIVPVVCLGNADCDDSVPCTAGMIEPGTNLVSSPAAATYAITVQASNDGKSVKRDDDDLYSGYLEGPRLMPAGFTADPLGQKPDITAPGERVKTLALGGGFLTVSGTSYAAPLVAGAAALIRQKMPTVSPAAVKDLLLRTADLDPISGTKIPERYGAGYLNVYAALNAEKLTDVAFPACDPTLDPADSGSPCPLEAGMHDWINYRDIEYTGVFGMGLEIEFQVHVENRGDATATDVIVSLAVHPLGAGS
ncbi:MAG TPA: S8 family serine peptidase, partial [Candidatus Eisenbacteria bacterium]|nr:S8 family serine peptidase [Candidatus Eisenbacteria bacterium]